MSAQTKPIYEFGPFRLDPVARLLLREGRPVSLTPKMFDILLLLVQYSGQVVEKEELMRTIWPDTFVEEANLAVNISALRKALSEAPNGHQYIETVQRRGYRFEARVRKWGDEAAGPREQEAPIPTAIGSGAAANDRALNGNANEKPAKGATAGATSPELSIESLINAIKCRPKMALLAMIIITGVGIVLGIYKLTRQLPNSPPAFQTMKITRLTTSGRVVEAAISPDGKYIVQVIKDVGRQSLWVRQLADDSNAQILPPSEDQYGGLLFSRDGSFIYFLKRGKSGLVSALYKMPVLGGMARKVVTGLSTPITLSPDGERLAFLRNNPTTGETALIVANADGAGEQKLTARHKPEVFTRGPAWSPDSKIITCQIQSTNGTYGIIAIPVGGGVEELIAAQGWEASQITWLPNGSGLIMAAAERVSGFTPSNPQIWQLSYPGGKARRITNDLNNYRGVSLTADGNTLITVLQDELSNIWLVHRGDSRLAKQITFGIGKCDGLRGLAWTSDGRIVYDSNAGGRRNIWIVERDGGNPKQLTVNSQGRVNADPTVSPDGRFMVYVSATDLPHLWRMDLDGGNPRQLTNGSGETSPRISPDGKWIIYVSLSQGNPVLSKMPVDGGTPVQLTDTPSTRPVISPDGKLVAYHHWDEQPYSPPSIVIIPISGGVPIKSFKTLSQQIVRWAPNGQALTYVETRDGVSNIWGQPLDGGPPKQLTNFKAEQIRSFDWSPDGQLAISRGVVNSDVVLISDFKWP